MRGVQELRTRKRFAARFSALKDRRKIGGFGDRKGAGPHRSSPVRAGRTRKLNRRSFTPSDLSDSNDALLRHELRAD